MCSIIRLLVRQVAQAKFKGLRILIRILYTFLISPMQTICPARIILLNFIILKYLVKSTNYEAPHSVFSYLLSLFSPRPKTALWGHLTLCPSLNVRDQVLHPYKTTAQIIVWCISHIREKNWDIWVQVLNKKHKLLVHCDNLLHLEQNSRCKMMDNTNLCFTRLLNTVCLIW
jgi:hypothetical protein